MRTRKTFYHEDGIYDGVSRLPEPRENHYKEIVSIEDAYDWYPEKHSTITTETEKFEESVDIPLGAEYRLQSQIDNYSKIFTKDALALAALNDEINNLAV